MCKVQPNLPYSGLPLPGNTYKSGRISTIDLLAPTSSDKLFVTKIFILFPQNKEVNRTESSPSVRVPRLYLTFVNPILAPKNLIPHSVSRLSADKRVRRQKDIAPI
jgi:hypothetical protein